MAEAFPWLLIGLFTGGALTAWLIWLLAKTTDPCRLERARQERKHSFAVAAWMMFVVGGALILLWVLSGCSHRRETVQTRPPMTAEVAKEVRELRRAERLNLEAGTLEGEVNEAISRSEAVTPRAGPVALTTPQPFYLRWDRPYPEDPTNRYEVWMATNLASQQWSVLTNTRFGEMRLDVTRHQQAWFIVRTAQYQHMPGTTNVWWDGPVEYSEYAHR